jgi:hypothetical protein
MKKNLITLTSAIVVSAMMLTSCGSKNNETTDENSITETEEVEVVEEISVEVSQAEIDGNRMAEIVCQINEDRKNGIEPSAEMNQEMMEINNRFNAEYSGTDKEDEFKRVYEAGLASCM